MRAKQSGSPRPIEGLDISFKLMVRCKDVLVGFAAKAQRREGEDEFLGGIIGCVVGTFN